MGKHGPSVSHAGVLWHPRGDGYYQNSSRGLLHRYVWAEAHGAIPAGMHVHHLDHDKRNNELGNLALLKAGDHAREHLGDREDWHAKGGRATWAGRPYRDFTCTQCGESFKSRGMGVARFCSPKCRDAGAPSRAKERRVCSVCGDVFECPQRRPTRTCSRKCTSVYAYTQRGARL